MHRSLKLIHFVLLGADFFNSEMTITESQAPIFLIVGLAIRELLFKVGICQ